MQEDGFVRGGGLLGDLREWGGGEHMFLLL